MEYLLITGIIIIGVVGIILYVRQQERANIIAEGEKLHAVKNLEQKDRLEYDLNKLKRIRDRLFQETSPNGNNVPEATVNKNFTRTIVKDRKRNNRKNRFKP